ncbi:DUF5597 domain-containing protein [Rathayibacter sp. KR2-224]|uniref:DUF5597 domain-containing protein n=1 Tax=Rathayibacter sp. KR2-224 TaxID=3400913 RepID=UPI003C0FC320
MQEGHPGHVKEIRQGRFFVDGTRRLLLGAELHNSSSSTETQIARSFERVRALGATTVLAPIAWETIEPDEGRFDFTLVDFMLETARSSGLGLIPLWFGSWKNGMSTYVPGFVKTDPRRFPRARTKNGPVEILSPFSAANRDADAAAFGALTRHLSEVAAEDVVEMIQVENEVGLLGGARDVGEAAEESWNSPVPAVVLDVIRTHPGLPVHTAWRDAGSRETGTWPEIFGASLPVEEAFMAAAYAEYVNAVALKGREAFDVPMFVNAWLELPTDYDLSMVDEPPAVALAGGRIAGVYPSGGPVRSVVPIWRAAAPAIDLCAPDIYAADFDTIAADYRELAGGLLIPEMQRGAKGVAHMFRAVGEHDAMLVSPFGADSVLSHDESAQLRDGYHLLAAVAHILKQRPNAETRGFMLTKEQTTATVTLGDLQLTVTTADPLGLATPIYPAYAVIVHEAPGRIFVVARGCSISANCWGDHGVGIRSAIELDHVNGTWQVVRVLNGDESGSGRAVRFPHLAPTDSISPIPSWSEATGIVSIEYYQTEARVSPR